MAQTAKKLTKKAAGAAKGAVKKAGKATSGSNGTGRHRSVPSEREMVAMTNRTWRRWQDWTAVVIGVLTSIVLAFPYLRVVVMMWLSEPGETTPTVSIPGVLTSTVLGIGTVAGGLLAAAVVAPTSHAAAPTVTRNRLSVSMPMRNPWPGSPSSRSRGTRQFSNVSVASGCGAITSMRSAIFKPGVSASTMNAEMPLAPSASPVRAKVR